MVESFWKPYRPGIFGSEPSAIEYRRFDSIKTESDYQSFIETNPFFKNLANLPDRAYDVLLQERAISDYYDIRNTFDTAAALKHLNANHSVSESRLKNIGVQFDTMTLKEWVELGEDEFIPRELSGLIASLEKRSVFIPRLKLLFEGRTYPRFLTWAASGNNNAFVLPFQQIRGLLDGRRYGLEICEGAWSAFYLTSGQVKIAHQEAPLELFSNEVARNLFDALCNLNLTGIEAREIEGRLRHYTDKGISSLWLSFCEELELNSARIAECPACGRAIVVTEERGTQRIYCKDSCRQWAKKHPGETRSPNIKLKRR